MINTIRKAWGIPELRKKIIFTLLILLIFRIGNAITVPYINTASLKLQLDMMGDGYLYNLREDPHELHNRWGDPACAAQQADMLWTLSVAMMRAADPLPPPRARYRVKTHPRGWWDEPIFCEDPGVTRL